MVYHKKHVKKHYKRKYKRKAKKQNGLVTYNSRNQMPYPSHFRAKFTLAGHGLIGAASGPNILMSAKMNSAYLPLNVANPLLGLITIATATAMPGGLTALLNSNAYNHGRVLKSKCWFRATTITNNDAFIVTITPSKTNGIPSSVGQAEMEPYTKRQWVTYSTSQKCSNTLSQAKFLGVSEAAVQNDLSNTAFFGSASDPTNIIYWTINLSTVDNAATGQIIGYEFGIEYYVDLFDFDYANIKET